MPAEQEAIIAEDTQLERDSASKNAPEEIRKKPIALFWILPLVLCVSAALLIFARLPETPLQQAENLIRTNRAAAALPILENLAQTAPADHSYLPLLAQCYLQTDRLAEGRTALDTAIKCKLAASTLTPVVKSFNKYYRQKNEFAEAEKLLNSAYAAVPASEFQDERKELYKEWAEFEAQNSKTAEAIQHLEAAAALDASPNPQTIHRLAELYREAAAVEEMQNGDDKKAIALLEKSLTVSDEPASRMALANLYSKNNEIGKSIEALQAVCKADPNNLEARHRLVESCIKIENYKGAQEAAAELAERERCSENYQMLAALDLKLSNFAGAVRALEEACNLAPKDLLLLAKLEDALKNWAIDLQKLGKLEDSQSVKARADRVTEMIKAIEKEQNPDLAEKPAETPATAIDGPPVSLAASRIWLSKGSLTPEGEIKVKNSSTLPVEELALTVAFFDHTWKRRTGSVSVTAAGPGHPLMPGETASLYFSSPNIVKAEHQLSVLIYWKGKLIRELPVVKER